MDTSEESLESLITAVLDLGGGCAPLSSLRDAGVGRRRLRRRLQEGSLVRVRHGIYADAATWSGARPEYRYAALVKAASSTAKPETIFSHASAAVLHGLSMVRFDERQMHVTDADASGGSSKPSWRLHRSGGDCEPVNVNGVLVTPIERTVVDLARTLPFADGLVVVDSALRGVRPRIAGIADAGGEAVAGLVRVTRDRLMDELDQSPARYGRTKARAVIEAGSDLSGSAGESLSRGRMIELGFELPDLQVRFDAIPPRGAVVDFYWQSVRKIGEFDGAGKYLRSYELSGLDPAEVVLREKRREDALRRLVGSFERWGWREVIDPLRFARFLTERGVPRAR